MKGVEKTAKWLITDHTGATERCSIMELEQRVNFHLADINLMNRRMKRLNDSVHQLIDTGIGDSTFEVAVGWLIDHALYVFDLCGIHLAYRELSLDDHIDDSNDCCV